MARRILFDSAADPQRFQSLLTPHDQIIALHPAASAHLSKLELPHVFGTRNWNEAHTNMLEGIASYLGKAKLSESPIVNECWSYLLAHECGESFFLMELLGEDSKRPVALVTESVDLDSALTRLMGILETLGVPVQVVLA